MQSFLFYFFADIIFDGVKPASLNKIVCEDNATRKLYDSTARASAILATTERSEAQAKRAWNRQELTSVSV